MKNNNWKITYDREFMNDVDHWSKKIDGLQTELRSIAAYILEYGEIPEEYNPHKLTDTLLPYTGNMDFHLLDGKVDIIIIYAEINKHKVFRFMRLGSHSELFH
ncbi:type II toxin-antitoxin system YafQ family toxin [Limosilactobacillus mucosae]|uniref:Type II toxin-antitoxin system YafQ family toxin n=1 Tax=Limosilactobacillus mucosae TaxID=97478 RepID=A0AAJ1HPU0_LIMMU|nr:type II toxin-antitoxin system YafQ family toxin [Limosilactobacillus mucosae]MDC2828421.1 type II toxin-antitoxin system YafQ family toxin [Limosilactobacillus mucosae]MDC2834319.1 type II toxin-antitoxin system YafQ family toxin [Limosilactobacillus mucosae]